ncbi:bifunctional diguanylate cyclase/phosphodiesterase [Mycolicibacterium sp. P9-22]|uniref:putative bifunctional diguanylate cyclase/phosphodiesterase n=1 Tax=Mycolicibacterium sp. P9-22 TaxID=2024613 RepID=UPI001D146A55|nr:EAL domain-containing protein [Mycolicibacterium sp. P9-22]
MDLAAKRLITAHTDNVVEISELVLADLAAYLGLDVAFLRHNDHEIHATRLVAEWPVRPFVPDPDPIGVVYFADADPVFAMAERLKEPLVIRPAAETDEYQQRIQQGTEVPQISMACVPLLSNDVTTGTLGFVKYGDREWLEEELNALKTIATMLAQLQARLVAIERLQFLAEHDDLTGLCNNRVLTDHLDGRLASGQDGPVAVLFADLDRLKSVNDLFGHAAGDEVIAQFARRLRESFSDIALLARQGGDEFVLVLNEPMELPQAELLADRIRLLLREPFAIGREFVRRTASIGVAVGVPGRDSASDVLRYADLALEAAKGSGGNDAAVFTDAIALKYLLLNDVELHLRDGIESEAFVVHYQPEVDLRTGKVVAVEALVRWNHPTRGMLLPSAFMPVAESSNLAAVLGRKVLQDSCAQLQQWKSMGLAQDLLLRVNVSPVQRVADGFADHVARVLTEYELDPASLSLEFAESFVTDDADLNDEILTALRALGVGLALDEFGAAYSDLSRLKSLPIDTLKIDRSFVQHLDGSKDDLAIIRAIVSLGEAFGLGLVAVGLETEAAAQMLVAMGCHQAQGFLLSPPVDPDTMAQMLAVGTIAWQH